MFRMLRLILQELSCYCNFHELEEKICVFQHKPKDDYAQFCKILQLFHITDSNVAWQENLVS